jgi:predicted nucleic acid-binding protein
VDAVQIAAALDAEADAFLTNDKKLSGITEIKIIVLSDYLVDTPVLNRT